MSVYKDGPDSLLDVDRFNGNPIINTFGRRGRSQLAPGSGLLYDFISGTNFVGDPLRDTDANWNGTEVLNSIAGSMTPFWLDGSFQGSSGFITAPAEIMGINAYEIQDYDKLARAQQWAVENSEASVVINGTTVTLDGWRKDRLANNQDISWTSLPKLFQEQLLNESDGTGDATLVAINDKFREVHGERAVGMGGKFAEYSEQRANILKESLNDLSFTEENFLSGIADGRDVGTAIRQANTTRRNSSAGLLKTYKEMAYWFSSLAAGNSDDDKRFQGDIVYEYYSNLVSQNPANYDDEGFWLPHKYRRHKMEFFEHPYLAQFEDYIDERGSKELKDFTFLTKFEDDKKILEPYWDITKQFEGPAGEQTREAKIARYFLEQPSNEKIHLQQKGRYVEDDFYSPNDFAYTAKRIDALRLNMRVNNQLLDRTLSFWSYTNPIHPVNIQKKEADRENMMKYRMGDDSGWGYKTPSPNRITVTAAGRIIIKPLELTINAL